MIGAGKSYGVLYERDWLWSQTLRVWGKGPSCGRSVEEKDIQEAEDLVSANVSLAGDGQVQISLKPSSNVQLRA
jgi:hypothetical protein